MSVIKDKGPLVRILANIGCFFYQNFIQNSNTSILIVRITPYFYLKKPMAGNSSGASPKIIVR
jgi:hypothetical protein